MIGHRPHRPTTDLMDAPIEIPNFELFKEIGRGGMSRVYLAHQLQPKREVAIKIVSPGSAPEYEPYDVVLSLIWQK